MLSSIYDNEEEVFIDKRNMKKQYQRYGMGKDNIVIYIDKNTGERYIEGWSRVLGRRAIYREKTDGCTKFIIWIFFMVILFILIGILYSCFNDNI